MTILLVLVPLSALLLLGAVGAFVWAVRHDQFEDLESEGARILFDDLPEDQDVEPAPIADRSPP